VTISNGMTVEVRLGRRRSRSAGDTRPTSSFRTPPSRGFTPRSSAWAAIFPRGLRSRNGTHADGNGSLNWRWKTGGCSGGAVPDPLSSPCLRVPAAEDRRASGPRPRASIPRSGARPRATGRWRLWSPSGRVRPDRDRPCTELVGDDRRRRSDVPVLIEGNGSGKELVARGSTTPRAPGAPVHRRQLRAISPELIESELFGHEKGVHRRTAQRGGSNSPTRYDIPR